MKKITAFEEANNIKINPQIRVNPNPAPRKMALAMSIFEEYNAAKKTKHPVKKAQSKLTNLQKELLDFYIQEPTETQLQQVKVFLSQLLKENIQATEMPFESKIAA